jgi:hypothetical protein
LITEGNLSDYHGGVDKHGNTNANRKEKYHNLLAKKIREENGKTIERYQVVHVITFIHYEKLNILSNIYLLLRINMHTRVYL